MGVDECVVELDHCFGCEKFVVVLEIVEVWLEVLMMFVA